MHARKRSLRWLPALFALALAFPAHAVRDPEFPPDTIVVLASVDSNGNAMAGKFTGKVDYVCDGTNDQVEIQKAIDEASTPPLGAGLAGQGGTVLLVGGKFYISDTIDLIHCSTVTIRGMGGRGASGTGSEHTVGYGGWAPLDNTTALIWTGADEGTMFNLQASHTCTFENLLLFGKNGAESNTAGILMHVTTETTYGSGGHRLINVTFQSADQGLVLGEDEEDLNCDNIYGERLGFAHVDKGVVLKNSQSLPHTFIDVKSLLCSTAVFYIEHGGNITVLGGSDTGSEAYVHFDGAGGINTEPLLFQGIRMEKGTGTYTPTFLRGDCASVQHVTMIACAVLGGSTDNDEYSLEVGQGVFATARDCVFSGRVARLDSDASAYPASLILDACAVREPNNNSWSNLISLATAYTKCKVQNCYNVDSPLQALDYNRVSWPDVNQEVIIWSGVVDARTTQTVYRYIYGAGDGGQNTMFFPTEVGVQYVNTGDQEITTQPNFGWGSGGSWSLGTAVATATTNCIEHYPVTSLAPLVGGMTGNVSASVISAAVVDGDQPVLVRFFWKGYVQRSE